MVNDVVIPLLQEPIHKLAWTLDACLNDRTLDARRTQELQNFFALHDTSGALCCSYHCHFGHSPTQASTRCSLTCTDFTIVLSQAKILS